MEGQVQPMRVWGVGMTCWWDRRVGMTCKVVGQVQPAGRVRGQVWQMGGVGWEDKHNFQGGGGRHYPWVGWGAGVTHKWVRGQA